MKSCFPCLGRKEKTNDRVQLLTGRSRQSADPSKSDLRRLFSRDVLNNPEQLERDQVDTTFLPSSSADTSSNHMERLFSRQANKSPPVGMNRLFSRGAVGTKQSSDYLNWQHQRKHHSDTIDSVNEDYGEVEPFKPSPIVGKKLPLLETQLGRDDVVVGGLVSPLEQSQTDQAEETEFEDTMRRMVAEQVSTAPVGVLGPVVSRQKTGEISALMKRLETVSGPLVPGLFQADTEYHPDHTYSGIMFDIEARRLLPYQFLEIQSLSVRGELGPVKVYVTQGSYVGKHIVPSRWVCHFDETLPASVDELCELHLQVPVRLAPGTTVGIYIHSQLPNDKGIVYSNNRSDDFSYEDRVIRILPKGIAHTSPIPFSEHSMRQTQAWRHHREFVGSVRYGFRLLLWTPEAHYLFPRSFRVSVFTLLCAQHVLSRTPQVSFGSIPKELVFYIINFLPYNWFPLLQSDMRMDEEQWCAKEEFTYKGHTGRIAKVRQMFDQARVENMENSTGITSLSITNGEGE